MTTNNSRFLVGVVLGMAILFVAEREFSGQALSQVTGPGMNTGTSVATSTVAAAPVPTMVPLGVTPPTVTVADHPLGITYAVASLATDESGLTVPGTVSIPATGTANVCPRVSGQVVQVIVHVGQSVRAGQTLATIRSLDIATAQATLQQDQEQVHFARLALNHQLQLAHLGSFSQKPVEDARSAYTAAQATELADQNSEEQDVMSVQSDQAGAEQDETQLKQDQLDADNDQIITDREQKLYLDGIAAKEDYEAAKTTSDKDPEKLAGDKFKIDADDVKVQSDKAKVDGDLTHIKTDDIQTKIARAALDRELHVLGGDIYTAQNVESAQSTLNAAQLQVEQAVETLKIHGASETGTDGIVPVPAASSRRAMSTRV